MWRFGSKDTDKKGAAGEGCAGRGGCRPYNITCNHPFIPISGTGYAGSLAVAGHYGKPRIQLVGMSLSIRDSWHLYRLKNQRIAPKIAEQPSPTGIAKEGKKRGGDPEASRRPNSYDNINLSYF